MNWLKSLINLIPTIIGIVQAILPLLKELAVTVVRIIAILPFAWSVAEPIIEKINKIYVQVNKWVEKIKNLLLWIPK